MTQSCLGVKKVNLGKTERWEVNMVKIYFTKHSKTYFKERRNRVGLIKWQGDLGGDEERETVIRISCTKNSFTFKKKINNSKRTNFKIRQKTQFVFLRQKLIVLSCFFVATFLRTSTGNCVFCIAKY